ncbi:hypothetical protein N7455_008868 [Penicillium solitum]|uniref:uncharacterized protein n=1 Tax=Penicillium solitum TaxID=60172 RepID=UPI00179FD167|nr:hypothetical protein HAV15_008660 [Penicillium sp. str. \
MTASDIQTATSWASTSSPIDVLINNQKTLEPVAQRRDWSSFIAQCNRAPRLNEFKRFFSDTAGGRSGQPLEHPQVDRTLLPEDELLDWMIRLHEQRRGRFDPHYHASIPYRVEEACRLGRAILLYSQSIPRPLHLYSIGSAEGTMARTVAELGQGRVESLACSPNVENYESFILHGDPPHASFFVGPFHHLTRDVLQSRPDLARFASGFDVIIEDTTFQMYSPNRVEQIEFIAQNLRENGIVLFLEKFRQPDMNDYLQREEQKDRCFKAKYFDMGEIASKKKEVLTLMNQNEVTIDEMTSAVKRHFSHCFITWNSGNFHTLIASNSLENLNTFMAGLVQPAVPKEFVYETLPRRLCG